jgi:hypothetical protein
MWKSLFFKFRHNITLVFLLFYTPYPPVPHFESLVNQATNLKPCILWMKRFLCVVYNHPVDNMLLGGG